MSEYGGETEGAASAIYEIAGGDFERAGEAAAALKRTLKRVGVEPEIVRRAAIAAYEAEMNVVIHARKGRMEVALGPRRLDVTVVDEGPGIPDVAVAMREGFSTASARARKLGFGGGMGLPNIRKCSDGLAVESEVGRGTTLRFHILLQPAATVGEARNSVRIRAARCTTCLRCVRACPTGALRVRDSTPTLLAHRCIDCAECLAACTAGALAPVCDEPFPEPRHDALLVMNAACAAPFDAEQVETALAAKGFRGVRYLEEWEAPLLAAIVAEAGRADPVIAPVCPAALNLIAVKFPALLGQVAPYLSPIEAAAKELADVRAVFAAACPAQATAVASGRNAGRHRVGSARALELLLRAVRLDKPLREDDMAGDRRDACPTRDEGRGADERDRRGACPTQNSGTCGGEGILRVYGIRHVMRVLEEMENGLLGDVAVIAPYACDLGCYGSPLMIADAFAAWYRSHRPGRAGRVFERGAPLCPRSGLRLDPDMRQAIAMLGRIDALQRRLPGRDCAVCGAPTCEAFAEDVVFGRAPVSACPYRTESEEGSRCN